ncbi:SH3 domain-containing protein [Yeosuana marina]|uniref:SH3 domain-containing protein n=1 Tax=Yeosuana marina TaxID=1565536 RepID=UPI0030C85861
MKLFLIILLTFLQSFVTQSQNTYFVTAESGLIIREQPKTSANRIGKLPYGSIVEVIEKTNITMQISDQEDVINGEWVKVKFQNYPYIIIQNKDDYKDEGYVFSGYLEKLKRAKMITTTIDSLKFYSLYKPIEIKKIKIESQEEVEQLLASKVSWKDVEFYGRQIDKIYLNSGQVLSINQDSFDCVFVAYYPTESIMLFEGGHSSDFSININTGEITETTGNPEYIIESPNKTYRLNGWFGGQECSTYFFQEKNKSTYKYLIDLDWHICYYKKFCWINDTEFLYSFIAYSNNGNEEKYVKGQIIPYN